LECRSMAQNRVMSASCSGSEFANYQPTPDDGLWEAGYMIFRLVGQNWDKIVSLSILEGPTGKLHLTDITVYSASGHLADRVRIPPSPPIQNPSIAGVFYWL